MTNEPIPFALSLSKGVPRTRGNLNALSGFLKLTNNDRSP